MLCPPLKNQHNHNAHNDHRPGIAIEGETVNCVEWVTGNIVLAMKMVFLARKMLLVVPNTIQTKITVNHKQQEENNQEKCFLKKERTCHGI